MSKYEALDAAIIDTIDQGMSPLYCYRPLMFAEQIANEEGRQGFRVIDCRVQALRKAGRIQWLSKKDASAMGRNPGWNVIKETA